MKIALVTQHYPPYFEGGTEAVVRSQARELAALGHELRVVSGTDRPHAGTSALREEVDGIPVAFLPRTADEPFDLILERPRLLAHAREECAGCDLVHVHHWSTLDNSLVRTLSRDGLPVVVTLHDLFTTCPRFFRVPVPPVERCPEPGDVEPCVACVRAEAPGVGVDELRAGLGARGRVFAAEVAAAARVVTPSRAQAERLAPWLNLGAERVSVVPHGLCTSPGGPAAASDGGGKLCVLHHGHRSWVKGTRELVNALAALPSELARRVELILVGAEVQAGFDDELRAAAGEVSLTFHGAYDGAVLSSIVNGLGGAHVAAFPSRAYESYGLVVDEAQALGLPVLVSDRGAPKERVGGAGRVLPVGDAAPWTRTFRELLEQPSLLGRWRAALPSKLRTAADAARELDELYRTLLQLVPRT